MNLINCVGKNLIPAKWGNIGEVSNLAIWWYYQGHIEVSLCYYGTPNWRHYVHHLCINQRTLMYKLLTTVCIISRQ